MRFELKTAWRELRASWRRFLFAIVAVGIGVGALSGVKGFSEALQTALLKQSRELIASDFVVRSGTEPGAEERQALEALRARGAESSITIETISMSSGVRSDRPILVSVKAVDPQAYPFFGRLELQPELTAGQALAERGAAVSEDFLQRLGLSVGDAIHLGAAELRIRAVLIREPDRLASGLEFGPRILISLDSLGQSNLIQTGSRVSRSFLFRITAAGYDLDEARRTIEAVPNSRMRITDYRRPNPQLDRGLERMEIFLSLVSLISLLVGGLGVAMSMHAYLQQKMDGIAVLKMLGGRSWQILRIYLVQACMIGTAGCLLGLVVGYGVQAIFPGVIAGLIDLPVDFQIAPAAMFQAFLIGLLSTTLLVVPPLLGIRHISPMRVMRRNMEGDGLLHPRNWRAEWWWVLLAAGGLLSAIGGIASWLSGSWQRGFGFLGFFLAALAALLLIARLMTALIPRVLRARSVPWKHGLANLRRPGSHATPIFAALGLGVMLTASVYIMQSSLLSQLVQSAPSDFPNLVVIGIPEKDRDPLFELLRAQAGILDPGRPIPYLPGRLRSVDGLPLEEYQQRLDSTRPEEREQNEGRGQDRGRRRFGQGEFQITWSQEALPDTRIAEGRWWSGRPAEPEVSVADFFSGHLNLHPGMLLEFSAAGKTVQARLTSVRSVGMARPGSNNAFIFSPGALEGFPFSYALNVRMRPESIGPAQKALFERFPAVTSIHVGEILALVQKLLDRISLVIQFVAGFAILAGMIIMASAVAATRQRRIRESVLFKTLGATRALVRRIHDVEFLVLGSAAGAVGTLAANGLAWYLLGHLLDTTYLFSWFSLVGGTIATAVLAALTGRLAGRGILNHKPLQVLREE